MDRARKVLLTNGEAKSTLAAVRSLSARGIEVHVAAATRIAIASWSRFSTRSHILPQSQKDPQAFVLALARLHETWGFDVVIPVADADIEALLTCCTEKTAHIKMALPSYAAFRQARDKSLTMKAAMRAGVPIPETYFPEDEPIEKIRDRAKYPLLIKPNISAGARGITMVPNRDMLCEKYYDVIKKWGPSHVQELIPDSVDGGQFKSDIVIGARGELLALFVCKKLRFFPVEGGSSTLIVGQHHAQIEQDVEKLTRSLEWYGFADYDFIVDPRDGIAKLMECNPRFPESLICNVFSGVDFPWLMFQLALGEKVDAQLYYRDGRYTRFLVGDIMWFIHSKDRWKASPSFFKFFGKDLKYYVEQFSDPGPTFCYLLESLRTLCSAKQLAYRFDRGFQRKAK